MSFIIIIIIIIIINIILTVKTFFRAPVVSSLKKEDYLENVVFCPNKQRYF